MLTIKHLQSRIAALIHDLVMIPFAWMGAYWLRYNLGVIPEPFLDRALTLIPVIVVAQGLVFYLFGLYRGVWRFASIPDFLRIAKAVLMGIAVISVLLFLMTRMNQVPRSVPILYGVLLFGFLGVPRLLYRWLKDTKLRSRLGSRTLIVGSGEGAEMLIRDLLRQRDHAYFPVAMVDDSPRRQGREIHGVRVKGRVKDLPHLVAAHSIELILIAIPSVTAKEMRRVVEACEEAGVPFRTLPKLEQLVSGEVTMRELREVSVEDLLGREPVILDDDNIRSAVSDNVVLVTGGAGSIGSELCRQIATWSPRELIVFDKSEHNLYTIEREFVHANHATQVRFRLADVCDTAAVEAVFREFAPRVVFHAAAYKHVPLLEEQVREAVRNNVVGTDNMARVAKKHGCKTFVFISTDKAVNPTNVMGATKRTAEIICQEAGRQGPTRFITVRFGNVLGSAGSVVPLFSKQIAAGGPVTVTHADVTRFFMTITEACQLILQAATLGGEGAIFVLDMGEPIKIRYLAEQMIRLSGKLPDEDINIEYTGLRPGEKLYEELFHQDETLSATSHNKILRARHRVQAGEYLANTLHKLTSACERYDSSAVRQHLLELVPEYGQNIEPNEPSKVIPLVQKRP